MRGDANKKDYGKPMWDLLPYRELEQIVKVLSFGANKYGSDQWKIVPEARDRYFAALMRHLVAWKTGEKKDKESGIYHLAHAGCCLLFLLYFDMGKE